MKIALIILLFICTTGYSQDTVIIFLDKDYKQIDKSKASFRREVINNKNYYKITDRNLDGEMFNSIEFRSKNPWIAHGKAFHYYAPDTLYSTGKYVDGKMVGEWIYYSDLLKDTVFYLDVKQLNELKECPPSQNYKKRKKSKIIGEEVLDSLAIFMKNNFHMPARPRGKMEEFTAYIKFKIDENGYVKCPEILNPQIIYNFHIDIESEINRILYNFNFVTGLNRAIDFILAFPYNEKGKVDDHVYLIVEEMPRFEYKKCRSKNSLDCFRKYIHDNLKIPNKNCSGYVFVEFIVEKNGKIEEIKIVRPINNCNGYIEEIERILRSGPDWIPGRERNQKVRVKYTIPISFNN